MVREHPLIAMIIGGLCSLAPGQAWTMEMANLESAPVHKVHMNETRPNSLEGGFELLEMAINNKEERLIWESSLSYGNDSNRAVVKFGLVTVLCRSPISLCHLGFERERTDAAQI